jgi:predicted small secreted protein
MSLARFAASAVLLLFAMGLCSCNTMKGFGEDLSHLGDKIAGKAREKTGD